MTSEYVKHDLVDNYSDNQSMFEMYKFVRAGMYLPVC